MPRRRFRPRRRFFRRRRKQYVPKTVKRYVSRAIKATEPTRFIHEYTDGSEIVDTGTLYNISDAISQGDGIYNREADTVRYKSIIGTMQISRKPTATSGTLDAVRVVMFQWHPDNNSEAPVLGDIIYDTTNAPYLSPLEISADRKKYSVLLDRLMLLPARGDGGSPSTRLIRIRIPGKSLQLVRYNTAATDGKNLVYILVLGNYATGTETSFVSYHLMSRFTSG